MTCWKVTQRILLVAVAACLLCCTVAQATKPEKPPGGGNGDPSAAETNPAIVFSSYERKTGNYQLVVASADLESEIQLTNEAGYDHEGPSWSPDGSFIAYWAKGTSRPALYVIRPDGSDQTLVRDFSVDPGSNDDGLLRSFGVWSPSGRELVYAAGNVPSLRAIDLTSGAVREILGFGRDPSVSPDLDPETAGYQGMIAFEGYLGDGDIFLAPLNLNENGEILPIDLISIVNLTDEPESYQGGAAWSPEGGRLAYYDSASDTAENLIVRDLATNVVTPLASLPRNNAPGTPRWTSDGMFILFHLSGDLMIVPSDGSGEAINYTQTRNRSERQADWNPAWDPTGPGAY